MHPQLETATLAACLTLFASNTLAQSPPCDARNDQTNVGFTGTTPLSPTGPNMHAYQVSPATTIAVQSARVFTGHLLLTSIPTRLPFMQLEIWSDNAGVPGMRLAGGAWELEPSRPAVWQGTNFDAAVTIPANTPHWLVWIEPGWSQPPIQISGPTVPSMRMVNGAWTSLPAEAVKYRLYCGLLDDQGVTPAGAACSGASGAQGTLFSNEVPTVGNNNFALEGTGFPAAAFGYALFGLIPGFPSSQLAPLPTGCLLHTDFAATTSGVTTSGAVSGHIRFPVPIPANAAFMGTYFSSQLGILDAALSAPVPLVTSNALRMTVF